MRVGPPMIDEPDHDQVVEHELGAPAVRTDPGGTESVGMGRSEIWFVIARWLHCSVDIVALPAGLEQGVDVGSKCRSSR